MVKHLKACMLKRLDSNVYFKMSYKCDFIVDFQNKVLKACGRTNMQKQAFSGFTEPPIT